MQNNALGVGILACVLVGCGAPGAAVRPVRALAMGEPMVGGSVRLPDAQGTFLFTPELSAWGRFGVLPGFDLTAGLSGSFYFGDKSVPQAQYGALLEARGNIPIGKLQLTLDFAVEPWKFTGGRPGLFNTVRFSSAVLVAAGIDDILFYIGPKGVFHTNSDRHRDSPVGLLRLYEADRLQPTGHGAVFFGALIGAETPMDSLIFGGALDIGAFATRSKRSDWGAWEYEEVTAAFHGYVAY